MKLHRVTFYVVDHDELGADGLKTELENLRWPNRCAHVQNASVETADIGEWDDSHYANYSFADLSIFFSEYAQEDPPNLIDAYLAFRASVAPVFENAKDIPSFEEFAGRAAGRASFVNKEDPSLNEALSALDFYKVQNLKGHSEKDGVYDICDCITHEIRFTGNAAQVWEWLNEEGFMRPVALIDMDQG